MHRYDLIVLGSGNAGMAAASTVRATGKSVAIIEARDVGGTCPLRGCVPKKVLVAAAEVLHQIDRAPEHHIRVAETRLAWPDLIRRKQDFVDGVSEDFAESLRKRGIDLYAGAGRFTGPDTIAVGDKYLSADAILIATGSRPRHLAIYGGEHLTTSEDLLNLETLPQSLITIGGGVIALEFAHVLARAGTKVTVLEIAPALLPRFDQDTVQALRNESERIGITVHTGIQVTEVAQQDSEYEVRFLDSTGQERSLVAEQVLNGTGRVADVADIGLEAAGIEHEGTQIIVDDYLRSTSNPRIFVAGDALWSSAQLSPLASYEGSIVGQNVCGGSQTPDYSTIPTAIFTVPALATVGYTEAEARDQGLEFSIKVNDMRQWRSARTHGETVAYSKILLNKGENRILGAHLVGHGSAEIIHLFALAMRHEIAPAALKDQLYAYPTFSSDIKYMI